jgi:hypothetical protein
LALCFSAGVSLLHTGNCAIGKAIVTGGAGTTTRTAGLLGGILTYAVEAGIIESNPSHGIRKPKDNVRKRRLSEAEYRKSCINDEQKAKQQLAGRWSKVPAPSRASCVSQESIGGTPSYVSLQTCLQMGQWAR